MNPIAHPNTSPPPFMKHETIHKRHVQAKYGYRGLQGAGSNLVCSGFYGPVNLRLPIAVGMPLVLVRSEVGSDPFSR